MYILLITCKYVFLVLDSLPSRSVNNSLHAALVNSSVNVDAVWQPQQIATLRAGAFQLFLTADLCTGEQEIKR